MPPSRSSEQVLPLSVSELRLVYGKGPDAAAVLDVPALAIEAGDHVAITGPSGSGKSSLLHVLTGIEAATGGSVVWGQTDITRLSEASRDAWRRRHVGFVFQAFHLVPRLSALQNVLLPFSFDHAALPPGARTRAVHLLDRVGLARHHDRPAAVLSRGEQQRVSLARALVRSPSVLVADEPTASLDPSSGQVVLDLLTEAARDTGATLVVVSHDPAVLERLPRIHRLVAGRIVDAAA